MPPVAAAANRKPTEGRQGGLADRAAARHRAARMRVRPSNLVLLSALPAFPVAVAPLLARWHWVIDLLACFPVQAMGWLLLSGVLLAIARRWWPAASCGLAAGVAAVCVVPDWCAPSPVVSAAPAHAPMRVLSLNLLRGNQANVDRALAVLRDSAPDVVFCSELTPAWLAGLEPGLRALPHRCVQADAGYYGAALFARWPLADAKVIPLGVDWAPAIRAVVNTPAGPVGVLGVHTARPGNRERGELRDRALAAIPDALAGLPAAHFVLGDFNATPWNPAFVDLLTAAGLALATRSEPTWPAQFPPPLRVPIDHVLISGQLAADGASAGAAFGSDHLPLLATLRPR